MRVARLPGLALASGAAILGVHLIPGGVGVVVAIAIAAGAIRSPWRPWAASAVAAACLSWCQLDDLASARARAERLGAGDRREDDVSGEVVAVDVGPDLTRISLDADPPLAALVEVTVRDVDCCNGSTAPLPGDRARVRGRLFVPRGYRVDGVPDPVRELAARGGAALTMSARPAQVAIARGGARPLAAAGARAQRRLATWIEARGPRGAGNAVMRAMLTGDRRAVDPAVEDAFRHAGISHLLSVSGLHLAVVALFSFGCVRRVWLILPGLARRVDAAAAAATIAIPVAIGYALITGLEPPTVRAAIAVVVVLVGHILRRRARAIDAIALAAIAIWIDNPCALFDPSFQLSFAAAATLALVAGGAGAGRSRWRRASALLRATAWATAVTAPITALHFAQLSVAGLATNLIAIPAIELVALPVGFAGLALSAISDPLGGALVDVAIWIAGWVAYLADAVARVLPNRAIAPPDALELGVLAIAWVAGIAWARGGGRRCAIAALAALAIAAGWRLWCSHVAPALERDLRITFVDVGQGDAAVIELPGGDVWLVDAGGLPFAPAGSRDPARALASPGERALLPFLRHRRIDRIDVAILSHPHPDHYAGLAALAGEIEIDQLWATAPPDGESWPLPLRALAAALAARGTRIAPPRARTEPAPGVTVSLLAPGRGRELGIADPVLSTNDNSLVVKVERGGAAFLFTGDIEAEGEQELVGGGPERVAADVVKVPHHGSRTSSTAALIAASSPRLAVISCGFANRFEFPDPGVEQRWRDAGARVWRTDRDGSVTVVVSADGDLALERH